MLVWVLCLVILGLAVASLSRYQVSATTSGRVVSGGAAMVLGVLGLVLLAALILT